MKRSTCDMDSCKNISVIADEVVWGQGLFIHICEKCFESLMGPDLELGRLECSYYFPWCNDGIKIKNFHTKA